LPSSRGLPSRIRMFRGLERMAKFLSLRILRRAAGGKKRKERAGGARVLLEFARQTWRMRCR